MLIVKDDVYKYITYRRLMIKAKMDKYQTNKIKTKLRLTRYLLDVIIIYLYYNNTIIYL